MGHGRLTVYGTHLAATAVLVLSTMAVDAQGDEVLRGVVSQHATKLTVMDLQVSSRPAQLASPSIPL